MVLLEQMTVGDLDRVGELARQLGYPEGATGMRSRFEEMRNDANCALYVARDDQGGQVLGWVQINIEPVQLITERRAEITALVVDENVRGQNIGKKLLARAEEWAREKGISLLRLRSAEHRTDAHRFYLRENYQHAKTSYVFTKKT